MNSFKKIVPKKSEKKRPPTFKRNNSFTEENKNSINTERFYTTYELFEKLNLNINKKKHFRANSSSKKKKKKKSIIKNITENNLTNNTHYSTFETDNNKRKKESPKKLEFSNILSKAKELLSIQSDLLIECGKLNKNLSKSEKEIETKLKTEINNNGTNVLPGIAKAFYLLEFKKNNNNEIKEKENNYNIKNNNINIKYNKIENENNEIDNIDNSFYIKKLNELNRFIGELGYSYVYNEFFNDNYKKENIIIYFDNVQKLINMLHQSINSLNEVLIKQENQIKEYEIIINDYQKNINNYKNNSNIYNNNETFNMNLISKASKNESSIEINNINRENKSNINTNTMNHILINENLDYYDNDTKTENENNNFINNTNFNTNKLSDNINSQEYYKNEECKNIFKDNIKKELPNNTHYYNSYINQLSLSKQNKHNNYDDNYNNTNVNKDNNYNEEYNNINNKQNFEKEKKINYLGRGNEQNILSSMIDSGSFFESYKRNKELKHNLNFIYNERKINNE